MRNVLFVLLVVLLLAAPVAAQETVPADSGEIVLTAWQVVVGVVTAILAGGIVGIAGVSVLVNRVRNDAATMRAIEKLGDSVPRETAESLIAILGALRDVLDFGIDVIDGEPDAPQEPPAQG